MTLTVIRRSVYALLLIGAVLSCSAPAPLPPASASSDVATSDGSGVEQSTTLGSIARQGATEPGAPTATASSSNAGSASTPDEAAARARVRAARDEAAKAQAQAAQQTADECQEVASQIRAEQATERAAPSTSIDEDIVNATLAKADKRIDRLQQQYESLGCSDADRPATHERVPQLPPAPGALPP